MKIIEAAIPFFFLFIGIELLVARLMRRRDVYRLNDSISDLTCGVFQQIFGIAFKVATVVAYALVAEYASIQSLFDAPHWPATAPFVASSNALGFAPDWGPLFTWVFAFLAYDLAYYWAHRMMHQTNLGWATHVVHHSSEDYNLTVALRQGTFQTFFSIPFYLPMALLGIPWEVFVTVGAINLIYQFWIHTRLIHKFPRWVELVFNTPSHHRVHHGREPKYIDKNHAGVFIVWDRIFGTFQEEEEEPIYGLTSPLKSWNPVWANLHFFVWIGQQLRGVRSVSDGVGVLFRAPGWRPAYLGGPILPAEVDRVRYRKWTVPMGWEVGLYSFLHFLSGVGVALATLDLAGQNTDTGVLLALGFFSVLSLTTVGGIMERQDWAWWLELARLGTVVAVLLGLYFTSPQLLPSAVAYGGTAFAFLSLVWLASRKTVFLDRGGL